MVQIDIDYTKIDSTLSFFPISVDLGDAAFSPMFSELGANKLKLYFEDSVSTKLYAEIENWDNVGEDGCIHVRVPSISSTATTTIYLYYGSWLADQTTYTGVVGSTPGQTVWDSDFVCVHHLSEDPTGGAGAMKDSTGSHNGTANNMESGDLIDGPIGNKALDFGGTDENITVSDHADFDFTNTFEAIVCAKMDAVNVYEAYVGKYTTVSNNREWTLQTGLAKLRSEIGDPNDGTFESRIDTDDDVLTTDWQVVGLVVDAGTWYLYVDGVSYAWGVTTGSSPPATIYNSGQDVTIGSQGPDRFINALISECRISQIARSAAWQKATANSLLGTLLTYT